MPGYAEIIEALKAVDDPELGISIVDLGLVYDAEVKEGKAMVTMTLTTPGCPAGPLIAEQVRRVLLTMQGVESASVEFVWFPAWNPQTMASEDGKAALGIW